MDSKRDSTLIDAEDFWDEGYLAIEAGNRLRVFTLFENNLSLMGIFRATIRIISEEDNLWKEYIKLIDTPRDPDGDGRFNDNMYKMSVALVCINVKRLGIDYLKEDLYQTIELLRTYSVVYLKRAYLMTDPSEEELGKWIRNRIKWLPLEIAKFPHIYFGERELLSFEP